MDEYSKNYRGGLTHAKINAYHDTDGLYIIDGHDTTLCMYDYAKKLSDLIVSLNVRGDEYEKRE